MTYHVIRTNDGELAIVPFEPSQKSLYATEYRAHAEQFVDRQYKNLEEAKRYAIAVAWFLPIMVIALLTFGAPGHAAELEPIRWEAPTLNVDGSAVDDLAGYRVHIGSASRSYSVMVDIPDPNSTVATVSFEATWIEEGATDIYVAMTAYDDAGNESGYSNEIKQVVISSDTVAPNPPTVVTVTISISVDCPAGLTCNVGAQ